MEPSSLQRLAVGNTSVVYAWGQGHVVKLFGADIPTHWAWLEAESTRLVHAEGLPVPEVFDVIEMHGRPAIVYERVVGRTMLEALVAPGADVVSIAHELADLQTWLHTFTAPAGLPLLTDRLETKIREVIDLDGASYGGALGRLSELESGTALCHGDLHPGNVILADTGPVIVDWFDAAMGSAPADVVRTSLLIRPDPHRGPPVHLPGTSNALLAGLHTAYLRRHLDRGGIDSASLRRWDEVVATARLSEPGCRPGDGTPLGILAAP